MWFWKKANTNKIYKDIIVKGFPTSIRQDVETVFDIIPLNHMVRYRFGQTVDIENLIHTDKQIIKVDNEILEIPARVYFNEPQLEKEDKLTELQKSILNCIYLRHHDGLVRQKRLDQLIGNEDYFIIPYKFHLLGEYVIQILEDMGKHITTDTIDSYVKFANDNEKYFALTESKMVSFWNAHYREQTHKLKDYIGRKNIDRIKKRAHSNAIASNSARP